MKESSYIPTIERLFSQIRHWNSRVLVRNQQELSHSEDLGKYEDQISHPKRVLQGENNAVCTALDYQKSGQCG